MLDSVVHIETQSDVTLPTLNFSGHESFSLRYPWLTKAVQSLAVDPELFRNDDAIVVLGVGKNMVRSIRHWARVTGLIDRSSPERLTELGGRLSLQDGWDPYLEDIGTLWLLHWQVVCKPEWASTWHYAFTRWGPETFTKDQLLTWLTDLSGKSSKRTSKNSIKRDVDVFLRTYLPSEPKGTLTPEEAFDSPLTELGLIEEAEKGTYHFTRSDQRTLPDEIFVYALTRYWSHVAPERQTLDAGRILHGPGSLGGAFKLTSNALIERLERLPDWCGLRFDDTAGLKQVLKTHNLADVLEPLTRYYEGGR